MDGFIVLNKPLGPSSHEVTAWAGKLLDSKAGHAGTLDPQAGGVLVIALGRAMKTLLALSECDKEYVCVARFEKDVDAEQLKKTLKEFTGRIYQTPPKESAVRKVMRTRVVHRTKLLEVAGRLALFRAHVQHGTYIRTLCSDMGEVMGNACEMLELLRTRAGPFSEMVTLQDVADEPDKFIMPIEAGVKQLKKIVVRDSAVSAIAHGAALAKPGVLEIDEGVRENELVAVMTKKGELVALATAMKPLEGPANKGFVAKPRQVVMDRSKYKKGWK